MARATIIVETFDVHFGWKHAMGQPASEEATALAFARVLEGRGTPARVYRRTPEEPEIIYESPNP